MQKQKTAKTTGNPAAGLAEAAEQVALPDIQAVLDQAAAVTTQAAKPVKVLCKCGLTVLNPCDPA